ncbi:MAG TPA: T9SS type A sorting domain-containing protein, partial [Chitinophagales bacterium]|nr:T9SS type A sorting domain-containing protein [Chitinophagales bacterium]
EIMPTTESGNFPTIHNFGNYPQCSGGNYLTLHNCFTAQPYSIGYFKVHFTPMYPLKLNAANLSELVVYPNPANSKIRVAMTDINTAGVETAKIQIFNIQGEIVFVGLFENYNEYDISTLPSGLFQIIITDFYGNFLKSSFVKVE